MESVSSPGGGVGGLLAAAPGIYTPPPRNSVRFRRRKAWFELGFGPIIGGTTWFWQLAKRHQPDSPEGQPKDNQKLVQKLIWNAESIIDLLSINFKLFEYFSKCILDIIYVLCFIFSFLFRWFATDRFLLFVILSRRPDAGKRAKSFSSSRCTV